ncbi:MAG: CDP-glycerol glycerophosphotransferase family protein [Clostridia bacterium]|nr:CDP-glycerol glycerophosphotransferase family protein [Clostridia bacterium]
MKEKIRKIIYKLPFKIFLKNIILLESGPDYSDSTYYVFKEMIKQGINKKYKLVWIVDDTSKFEDIKIENVIFLGKITDFKTRMKSLYYRTFAKYIIDSNKYVHKTNKNQYRIHLTHGSPVKKISEYWLQAGEIDSFIVMSDFWENISHNIFSGSGLVKKYSILGLPRNDVFFEIANKKSFFRELKRKKTILWLPTYRQHKNVDSKNLKIDSKFEMGIPCFNNIEEINDVNEFLKLKNTILIIKPHPAQDLSKIKELDCSNIKIIYDSYFENHSNLYEYLPSVDALITDYSSVYFDYLLANKPIGLAVPDLEEYTKTFEMPYNYNKTVIGEKILNYEDLIKFIDNVANGNDIMKEKRNEIKKIYHKHIDGNASKRVVEHLKKQMGCDKK